MLGPTILVIEEDSTARQAIKTVLQCQGFSVHLANNSAEAQQLFAKHHDELTLMLLDVGSGLEFFFSIPTLQPRVPALFTATRAESDLPTIAQHGLPCVCKPFTPRTLIESIAALCTGGGGRRAS
jgi:DNA-binding response OmpR family regulator